MIGLLLAAAMLPLSLQDVPAGATDDIVVVAERMRRFKVTIKSDRKTAVRRCVVKRTSGDARFDSRMCDTALACTVSQTDAGQVQACMKGEMDAYVREATARRQPLSTDRGEPPR